MLRIPATAVRFEGRQQIVWVVRDGKAEPVAVTLGETSGDDVEVLSGLSEGDQVVVEERHACARASACAWRRSRQEAAADERHRRRSIVRLSGVTKVYRRDTIAVPVLERLDLDVAAGEFLGADGAVRLGQVDDPEPGQRHRHARRRAG